MSEQDALAECTALLEMDDPHSHVICTVIRSADKQRIHTTSSRLAADSIVRHLTEMTGHSYEVVARGRPVRRSFT